MALLAGLACLGGGLFAGCGGFFTARTNTGSSSTPKFLFVANFNNPNPLVTPGAGSITGFTIGSDGRLSNPSAIGSGGNGANGLAVDPGSKFLYVTNDSGTIAGFAIHSTGTLLTATQTALSGRTLPLNPDAIVVDPVSTARFVYVANFGSANVSAFFYDANTGALAELTSSPFSIGNIAGTPSGMAMDPAGKLLFVAAGIQTVVFKVNTDGTLGTAIAPQVLSISSESVAVHPGGKFLYIADGNSAIVAFSIQLDAAGNPSFTKLGSFSSGGKPPVALGLSPSGALLYSANHDVTGSTLTGNIEAFTVRSDGVLGTVNNGTPFQAGDEPAPVLVDSTGNFLYVGNLGVNDSNGTGGISIFKIDTATGNLATVDKANSGAPNPAALAVTR